MPKLYDLHGKGSVVDIDPQAKKKTYYNHQNVGVGTKVVFQEEVGKDGKPLVKAIVYKTQDCTALMQECKEARNSTSNHYWGKEMVREYSIPTTLYWGMVNQGVDQQDVGYMQKIVDKDYSYFKTTNTKKKQANS